MGPFTLATKTFFGALNDTVEMEVSDDTVILVHHGIIEASQKKSGHRGSLSSWHYSLPMSAIQSARTEAVHRPGDRPAHLGRMHNLQATRSTSNEKRIIISAEIKDCPTTIALTGDRRQLALLESYLLHFAPKIQQAHAV